MTDLQNDPLSPYQLAVLDELLERQAELSTTSVPGAPTVPPSHDGALGATRPSTRRGRLAVRSVTAALAAAAAVVAVVLVAAGRAPVTPKWELAGQVSPNWQPTGSVDYDSGSSLVCPSATTCYLTGLSNGVGVQVTHDGGKTWGQLPPDNLMVRGIACVSSRSCALVLASSDSPPRFYFSWTTDGGQHWASAPAPDALSVSERTSTCATGGVCSPLMFGPMGLSCTTASSCVIVASSPPALPGSRLPNFPVRSVELVTGDRGRTWEKVDLPSRLLAGQVQCFAWGNCIATSAPAATVTALYSTDGGITWASASVPALSGFLGSLSCSDASSCTSVLFPPVGAKSPLGTLLVSKDGGRSWSRLTGPKLSSGKAVTSLSCPTSSDCWASADIQGTTDIVAPGVVPAGGLVASTTNGGHSWRVDQLPSTVQGVGAISCPTSRACFALGWSGTSSVLLSYNG